MSFPDKQTRKVCWDSRDRYWACLDDQNVEDSSERPKACAELRRVFENSCPSQWVTHFDRKRDFNVFKAKMQNQGFEPIQQSHKTMEELQILITNNHKGKNCLKLEHLQMILKLARRYSKSTDNNTEIWNATTAMLWDHLDLGFSKIDSQLLCATCFYTTVSITNKQDEYLMKVKDILQTEVKLRNDRTLQSVSLMYGMFQSSFLANKEKHSTITEEIIKITFDLLIILGYEYSQFTFIAFKTIHAFKKVCGTELQQVIFTPCNLIDLLNFTNQNWENPITGVRDLNRGIFQMILQICEPEFSKQIVDDISSFYWNKAKYLMVSEVIEYSKENVFLLMSKYSWMDGLLNSLHKPGLVSAGADMYYAVLKKIKNETEWCDMFLDKIAGILSSSSRKAIENFNNYWCLTTLKMFPSLMESLIEEVYISEGDHHLYSILFLMKQGSKLGILNHNWNIPDDYTKTEKLIICGLEHYDFQTRILGFEIICLSNSRAMPGEIECFLVLEYLINNVNSDCTLLRLNMLNSLNIFLSQLHLIYRNAKNISHQEEHTMIDFLQKLQQFIVWSLSLDGNYQRKLTSIKILDSVISCLSEIPRKRKQQVRENRKTLMEFLKENKCVVIYEENFVQKLISLHKDPSDDIRDTVLKLILNHYQSVFISQQADGPNKFYSNLVKDALNSIKNKFFYEINCGHVMFKLIINLLLKNTQNDTLFKSVDDVFKFAFNELSSEYNLERGILKSIEEGKQLHSFICMLQLVLEVCITNSYKLDISNEKVTTLLEILQGVTNQFMWEQNSASSDFLKMNEMIENIIEQSGLTSDEKDDAKISGLHQIVLNCLWLNVKASCDLAALLITYRSDDVNTIEKCLSIITQVLESSRHKGAIEAAGAALGKSIQHLTSLPEESNGAKLPQTLLESKLDMLISEASKMASITRRGAGLSIMVHRIVSSDLRKDKPLFHYFMKTLLITCKNIENVPNTEDRTNIENCTDLPKAILIHFLTKIVTDSSLASDMMFYSAELAELAFGNLASSHWQIRNAALQLYGALIPKLIGQKKASGTDDETIATVACDELRTHSPKLWVFITEQLNYENGPNKLSVHSNLIPILNLLANTAKRYSFSSYLTEQKGGDELLLKNLFNVLDSPIHTVRRLTAQCIFRIFPFEEIERVILNTNCVSENLFHGLSLLLKLCYHYYEPLGTYSEQLKAWRNKFSYKLKAERHSYCSKEIIDSIILPADYDIKHFIDIVRESSNNIAEPGISLWTNNSIKRFLNNSNWENIPIVTGMFLDCNNYELYCTFLLDKIEKDAIPNEILSKIANSLLIFEKKYNSCVIWNILYIISLKIELHNVNVPELLQELILKGTPYKLRYMIPFLATLFTKLSPKEQQSLQSIIFKLSNFENSDLDTRLIGALANNEIAKLFSKLADDIKANSIKTALLSLQDEDEDIRNISVNYYKNIKKLTIAVHPYICLREILSKEFLENVFCEPHRKIQVLKEDISSLLSKNVHCSNNTYNPFMNDAKNIYIEVNVLKQCLLKLTS